MLKIEAAMATMKNTVWNLLSIVNSLYFSNLCELSSGVPAEHF